ncbi:FTR1 family iron permease [Leptolyngbya sp. AN02str]|uniref:FTR1 family iron permease n=1 Tax=Leptolyngbya sp. AN02str TaxID=3423363 RepID=UPI003D30FC10
MDIAIALPTFVVTLREGVEAALVVGIVLAYLNKANQTQLNRWVAAGVGVGLLGSTLLGMLLYQILAQLAGASDGYAQVLKLSLEGLFGLVAIALLSWMLIWMTQQARAMKSDVEGALSSALQHSDQAEWRVFGLITIAVLREGFETVLFLSAQFQQGWMPVVGAIAGLLGAVLIGVLLFQLGIKINLRQFFQVMGVLLLLIVAGLVVSVLRHADGAIAQLAQLDPAYVRLCVTQQLGSCLLGPQVWNLSGILPDRQFPGVVLKALFGYRERIYGVQAIAYGVFLSTVGSLYLRSLGRSASRVLPKVAIAPAPKAE